MKFFGTGSVWDAQNKKILCKFEDGIYETEDAREIGLLDQMGFKFDGELEIKLDKSKKEVEELKEKLAEIEKSKTEVDPEIKEKLDILIEESAKMKEELAENERAKKLLIEKSIEIKLVTKKEAKGLDLVGISEILVGSIGE